ncbi:MAG: AbrB/MazE/SpoVT family DNA-binding domain-containing protein [Gemmatimonadota bacterium]
MKLRKIGASLGATLPKEMVDRLKLSAGDEVFAIVVDRGILISPCDPDVLEALEHAVTASRRYRAALNELAR